FGIRAGPLPRLCVRLVVGYPMPNLRLAQQAVAIGDRPMRTCRWQAHIPDLGRASRTVLVCRPIAREIAAKRTHSFLETGKFLRRIRYVPKLCIHVPLMGEHAREPSGHSGRGVTNLRADNWPRSARQRICYLVSSFLLSGYGIPNRQPFRGGSGKLVQNADGL